MSSHGLDKIPDSLGFMVLNEDGAVMQAGGEMEGQERIAGVLTSMIRALSRLQKSDGSHQNFQRVSIVYDSFLYVIAVNNQNIFVVKKAQKSAPASFHIDDDEDDMN